MLTKTSHIKRDTLNALVSETGRKIIQYHIIHAVRCSSYLLAMVHRTKITHLFNTIQWTLLC